MKNEVARRNIFAFVNSRATEITSIVRYKVTIMRNKVTVLIYKVILWYKKWYLQEIKMPITRDLQ